MATLDFEATDTPQDLGAALGIDFSNHHSIENISNSERVRFRFSPTAPGSSERGPILEPGEPRTVYVATTGDKVWVWVPRIGATAHLVVDEV